MSIEMPKSYRDMQVPVFDGGFVYPVDPIYNPDETIPLSALKYMQDKLAETLGLPEIIDKLGGLALELGRVAGVLEPTEVVDGEHIEEDPDWQNEDVVPLVGCTRFAVAVATSPMPEQRKKIRAVLAEEGYGDDMILDRERRLYRLHEDYVLRIKGHGRLGACLYAKAYLHLDRLMIKGRPHIGLTQSGLTAINVANLSHETAHALYAMENPVINTEEESESMLQLGNELRAYAVGHYMEGHLLNEAGACRKSPTLTSKVENIRREVNGPVTSKGAFDVHDDLIERLHRAGLDYIYKESEEED